MRMLRDKYRDPRFTAAETHIPFHCELLSDRRKGTPDLFRRDGKTLQRPFQPHEERVRFLINVLVGVQDVAVVFKNKIGGGGGDDGNSRLHLPKRRVARLGNIW